MEIAGIRVYTGGTNRLRSSAAPVSQVWRKLGIGNSLFLSRIRSRRLPLSETSELRVSNSLLFDDKKSSLVCLFPPPARTFCPRKGERGRSQESWASRRKLSTKGWEWGERESIRVSTEALRLWGMLCALPAPALSSHPYAADRGELSQ